MTQYKELALATLRILVADDTTMMRILHKKSLMNMGFAEDNLIISADGSEMIKALANTYREGKKVDLIICDWDMPKMTGFEILQRVRSVDLTKHIPFLMVTGHNKQEDIVKVVKSGCSGYIIKPFKEENFCDKVRELVTKIFIEATL